MRQKLLQFIRLGYFRIKKFITAGTISAQNCTEITGWMSEQVCATA